MLFHISILAWIFLGESLTAVQIAGLLVAFSGDSEGRPEYRGYHRQVDCQSVPQHPLMLRPAPIAKGE